MLGELCFSGANTKYWPLAAPPPLSTFHPHSLDRQHYFTIFNFYPWILQICTLSSLWKQHKFPLDLAKQLTCSTEGGVRERTSHKDLKRRLQKWGQKSVSCIHPSWYLDRSASMAASSKTMSCRLLKIKPIQLAHPADGAIVLHPFQLSLIFINWKLSTTIKSASQSVSQSVAYFCVDICVTLNTCSNKTWVTDRLGGERERIQTMWPSASQVRILSNNTSVLPVPGGPSRWTNSSFLCSISIWSCFEI